MKDTFIKFQLIDMNHVKCLLFTSIPRARELKFTLIKEGELPSKLEIVKSSSMNYINIFELRLPAPFEFGKEYGINLLHLPTQPIDVSLATTFREFDEMFNYDGDDLGSTYYKDHTEFNIWAPLASNVELKLFKNKKENPIYYRLKRTEKGVYRIFVPGDLLNARYLYCVTNSGATLETTDPYAKGVSTNSICSGVVDIAAIKEMGKIPLKTIYKNYVDASIYEVGIRDFTEQEKTTDIVNKGKYLGFIEEGRKTSKGHPAGLDYLSNLGISHVQLNPVIDFGSVDDADVGKKYNWGYDPISFFALEGSYSSHPEIPMERLVEFKKLVNKLHERNIGVVLDVVYNHIYEFVTTHFEKVVPNYFFRRSSVGLIASASGCGNDFASERFMVRKMIVDSLKYFTEVFDVDGFRFDLMGLLDIDTMKEGYKVCHDIKPNMMFYGEGWNMGMELPYEKKACSDNADKLPQYAFFNDSVRDIVKGPTFRDAISQKGYINGDLNYAFGLKYVLFGGAANVSYNARYMDANQSINYIECHDNNTLYDKLVFSNPDEDQETLFKRIKLANALISTIFGVPFYHMGQEIGLSKNGNDNTYNVLHVNDMNWDLVDERYEMVEALKEVLAYRKNTPLYSLHSRDDILGAIEYFDYEGLFIYTCKKPELINGFEELVVMYNPQSKAVPYEFDTDYLLVYGTNAVKDPSIKTYTRNPLISPTSVVIFAKEKEDEK